MDVDFFMLTFLGFKGSTECAAGTGCTGSGSFGPGPGHMSVTFYFEYKWPASVL